MAREYGTGKKNNINVRLTDDENAVIEKIVKAGSKKQSKSDVIRSLIRDAAKSRTLSLEGK